MEAMHSAQRRALLLIDGNALVHRAFHALPPLTTSKTGEMVNAVYGFANTLLKVVNTHKPSHWAIAFDYPAPTFRHKAYEQYKSQRPPTPEELKSQIARVHQLVDVLGIPAFETEGYEADDILGTLALQARELAIDTMILTGDRDLLQMVRPGISVLLPGRNFSEAVTYDEAAVYSRFGVHSHQFTAYKALVGDPSDNIPGVPGVGEKTAAKLLEQFESLEELYEWIDEATPARIQASLRESADQVKTSEELSRIVTSVPVELTLDQCVIGEYEPERALSFLKELEFNSLANRLPARSEPGEETTQERQSAVPQHTATLLTADRLPDLAQELNRANEMVLCAATSANGRNRTRNAKRSARTVSVLRGIGVATSPDHLTYLPVTDPSGDSSRDPAPEQVLDVLRPVLGRRDCIKVSDDAKRMLRELLDLGMPHDGPWFDIPVAAHLVGEKAISLEALASNRIGSSLAASAPSTGGLDSVSHQGLAEWLAARAAVCWTLRAQLQTDMHQRAVDRLFTDVEMPLIPVLAAMEHTGILVDTQRLRTMSRTLGEQMAALEIDIYNAVGHRFNINSPRQLGDVLFNELGLQGGRKTSSGYSTEASLLETLRGAHPVIDLVLHYRQLAKLKSTYVDTLPDLVNPRTDRLHTVFSQTGTTTGRLSSSEPNLQNLPIRTELGRTIRAAVVAPRGWLLLSADYSQIDLRALAHLSGDEALVSSFLNDEDIHTATASRVFSVDPKEVTPEMRRAAKVVNFGVIYGMSDYGLEQATEFSRAEAGRFIKAYFERHPGVHEWLEQTKAQARENLYVTTMLGRRRYIPEIRSTNRQVREGAERMAINAPVQGTSADIIKVAMVRLFEASREKDLQARMLLQIHDELLFEVPEADISGFGAMVRELMRTAVKLSVPLKVDLKYGPNWAEMQPLET